MIFSKAAQIEKLKKLRDMFTHSGTEPILALNAKELYEKLLEKYAIDSFEVEEEIQRFFLPVKSKIYAQIFIRIFIHIGVKKVRIHSKKEWSVECTQLEYSLFQHFSELSVYTYEAEKKKIEKRLKGFIYGVMDSNFPCPPVTCPKCKEPGIKWYDKLRKRACLSCGYTDKKKSIDVDGDAYFQGMNAAQTLNPKRLITTKQGS